jgi:hypothetical protein
MNVMAEILEHTGLGTATGRRNGTRAAKATRVPSVLLPWLRAQSVNVTRHAAALRPFRRAEFGTDAAAPTEGHIRAANGLIKALRDELLKETQKVTDGVEAASRVPSTSRLQQVLSHKEHVHNWVRAIERIWDFYFELFGQRQSQPYADWLLSCDRIALDCYQAAYMGLGIAKSIPSPPPFSYMRTGFSPATFRRRIPLRRLGRQLNPFPLIQLPYHRLVNPWTLGAVLHEVGHNLHNDLGLAQAIPRNIARRFLDAGSGRFVASVWARWNRELFADLIGLLLGGPAIVGSLMDIAGRSPRTTQTYIPRAVHPTPYLRPFLSIELLRRMGFADEAEQYRRMWTRLYPNSRPRSIPRAMLETFPEANAIVVDTVCFRPYAELGNKSLSQVIKFAPKEQEMIAEAAKRLSAGTDPGIIPERFLIGAARFALDHRLARPGVITKHFYRDLARR